MKHELEQVHIESYGLTGPEVVVAAAIKVYLMNLPWSDAKKKMDAVISLERGSDGRWENPVWFGERFGRIRSGSSRPEN